MMEKVSKFTVVGIGELLWDLLPDGERPGGAPANFAYHARALGAEAVVVSCVGDDNRGRRLVDRLDKTGLNTRFVAVHKNLPTGTVIVELDSDGKPDFTIVENVAWDAIPATSGHMELAAGIDAVCFGSLAQRSPLSRDTIWRFLTATKPECLRILDVNLRQSHYDETVLCESLERSNVLKLNEEELIVLGDLLSLGSAEKVIINRLMEEYSLWVIALTRGDKGSLLCTAEERVEHTGPPQDLIADTVGAGDSFTAAMTIGLLQKYDLNTISELANRLAGYVCSRKGAMPPIPDELKSL